MNELLIVPRRRDTESGKYNEVYSDSEIVELLRSGRLGTSEVADRIGCHRTTAFTRLKDLEKSGVVTRERVGNTYMWSLSGDE